MPSRYNTNSSPYLPRHDEISIYFLIRAFTYVCRPRKGDVTGMTRGFRAMHMRTWRNIACYSGQNAAIPTVGCMRVSTDKHTVCVVIRDKSWHTCVNAQISDKNVKVVWKGKKWYVYLLSVTHLCMSNICPVWPVKSLAVFVNRMIKAHNTELRYILVK